MKKIQDREALLHLKKNRPRQAPDRQLGVSAKLLNDEIDRVKCKFQIENSELEDRIEEQEETL